MRIGTSCLLTNSKRMTALLKMGFEFLELIPPLKLDQLPSQLNVPDVPKVWQCPSHLPAAHPDHHVQQAVLASWRQQLTLAAQLDAVLMVVQFERPTVLDDKTAFIQRYIELLAPLTQEARHSGVQLVLRNHPDNREQLQLLREIVRQVAGLGLALDMAYAHHGVNKNLSNEYLWDSDLSPRLAHVYVSDTNGKDPTLRAPLGSLGTVAPPWKNLVPLLRERYNASVTIDVGGASDDYLALSRDKWLGWWGT